MERREVHEELKHNPESVRPEDLCRAAESSGFHFRGWRPVPRYLYDILNFQNVRPLLEVIEGCTLLEDEGFIGGVPEPPGSSASGGCGEEALREVKVAVSLWLEAVGREGAARGAYTAIPAGR